MLAHIVITYVFSLFVVTKFTLDARKVSSSGGSRKVQVVNRESHGHRQGKYNSVPTKKNQLEKVLHLLRKSVDRTLRINVDISSASGDITRDTVSEDVTRNIEANEIEDENDVMAANVISGKRAARSMLYRNLQVWMHRLLAGEEVVLSMKPQSTEKPTMLSKLRDAFESLKRKIGLLKARLKTDSDDLQIGSHDLDLLGQKLLTLQNFWHDLSLDVQTNPELSFPKVNKIKRKVVAKATEKSAHGILPLLDSLDEKSTAVNEPLRKTKSASENRTMAISADLDTPVVKSDVDIKSKASHTTFNMEDYSEDIEDETVQDDTPDNSNNEGLPSAPGPHTVYSQKKTVSTQDDPRNIPYESDNSIYDTPVPVGKLVLESESRKSVVNEPPESLPGERNKPSRFVFYKDDSLAKLADEEQQDLYDEAAETSDDEATDYKGDDVGTADESEDVSLGDDNDALLISDERFAGATGHENGDVAIDEESRDVATEGVGDEMSKHGAALSETEQKGTKESPHGDNNDLLLSDDDNGNENSDYVGLVESVDKLD